MGTGVKDANPQLCSVGLFPQSCGKAIPKLVTLLSKHIAIAGVRISLWEPGQVDREEANRPTHRWDGTCQHAPFLLHLSCLPASTGRA